MLKDQDGIPVNGTDEFEDDVPEIDEALIPEDVEEEPEGDEREYIEGLKGKPKLINKLGLYTQEQIDAERKAANDNRKLARTGLEKTNSEIRELRERIESLTSQGGQQRQQAPASADLLEKYHESQDPNDLRAYHAALNAEMDARLDTKIKTETASLRKQQADVQSSREWQEVLSRPENKNFDMDAIDAHFAENPPSADEAVEFYRFRVWRESNPGKRFGDYMRTFASNRERAQGARTAPPNSGGANRPTQMRGGGYVSDTQAIELYKREHGLK